ncbi:polyamine ABC transporter substrate-binding protein [Arenibaculum pallidiluteum]|uniref:polyamine ABC transporter substrate-binding protein n=1 Tax=Arenibaculum pallidiluteum TaxID=2812559 RepID=UPI001A960795|nr:polyamine ABC transporter substrate-binding protein [Arenibaculum pallidiluteum]
MSRTITAIAAAAAAAFLAGPAQAQQKQVNIYNWNDYIGETTLEDFNKATGITAKYDVYSDLETLEQKLLAGRSGYDIIVPTLEPTLSRLIKAGAVQKLDKSKIPNLKNLDPELMKQLAKSDANNDYGVPYQGGTIGLGINAEKIKAVAPDAPLDSFALIFDPKWAAQVSKCGMTILDSATDTIPTALNYLGLSPTSEKAEDLKKVEEMLLKVRPHVKNFTTGTVINDLAAGDSCVALAYSGDVKQAQARAEEAKSGQTISYVMPKEGVQIWYDMMAIPKGAPNLAAAHEFINFVLQPEVMAGITNYVSYGNAVPASLQFVSDDIRNDPGVFPPEELKKKMFTVTAVSSKTERDRTRSWTRIKTGK